MGHHNPMISAEIVSVGTELLLGQIVDTHAPVMAQILASCGIGCRKRSTIGDNLDRLVAELKQALAENDVVVTIGGLGPTDDDLTRDGIAAALGDELIEEPEVTARLKRFFESRGVHFTANNLKQALRPQSAKLIDNPNGTAPGLLCQKNGKTVIALPGPAGEFNPMAYGPVKAHLQAMHGAAVIHSRTLRVIGIGESEVETRVKSLMDSANPTVAPYAHLGEVHLRVTAFAPSVEEADALIDPVDLAIRGLLGDAVFGADQTTLEASIIESLASRGMTVATAESMTGGGLGARLTSTPGSSRAYVGGFIVYGEEQKKSILGVDPVILERFGPVSREVAAEMAEKCRGIFKSDFGVSVTGNAGPTSDKGGRPVGLTYVGVASVDGTFVAEAQYRGIREDVRRRGTQFALIELRKALSEIREGRSR